MLEKLSAFWRVFKAGESVSDATAWKRGQITVAMLVTLGGAVLSLLHAFGVEINLSAEQLASIFGGVLTIVGLFNHASTVASTDKINLLGMAPAGSGDVAATRENESDAAPIAAGSEAGMPDVGRADSGPIGAAADAIDVARNSGA